MTLPIVKQFLEQNPNTELIFVSQSIYSDLFQSIDRLEFYEVELKKYKGLLGLYRLSRELNTKNFDYIIDLHNTLRTQTLIFFLKFNSRKIYSLDKGRKERKLLTRKQNKLLIPINSMHERYAQVFKKAGFSLQLALNPIKIPNSIQTVGIAPFAGYKEKTYPLNKMKNIVCELAQNNKKVLLFGGGKKEVEELQSWEKLHSNIESIAGKFTLIEELAYLKNIDVLISMDSSNMHLASIVETPCISIWGATHTFSGFLGFNQKKENCVENKKIACRPCSIYGDKKCFRKDLICLNSISEYQILSKIFR